MDFLSDAAVKLRLDGESTADAVCKYVNLLPIHRVNPAASFITRCSY